LEGSRGNGRGPKSLLTQLCFTSKSGGIGGGTFSWIKMPLFWNIFHSATQFNMVTNLLPLLMFYLLHVKSTIFMPSFNICKWFGLKIRVYSSIFIKHLHRICISKNDLRPRKMDISPLLPSPFLLLTKHYNNQNSSPPFP
jgi:hypothetical protein